MSFAGTLSWREPVLRWDHKLDLYAEPGVDDGGDTTQVSWHGRELVCRGVFPRQSRDVPYTEVWRRLPGDGGPRVALLRSDGHGVLVQVGDHALTIVDDRHRDGGYRACYRARSYGGWAASLSLGDDPEDLPAPPEPVDLREAMVLGGRRWHVLEHPAPVSRPLAATG